MELDPCSDTSSVHSARRIVQYAEEPTGLDPCSDTSSDTGRMIEVVELPEDAEEPQLRILPTTKVTPDGEMVEGTYDLPVVPRRSNHDFLVVCH